MKATSVKVNKFGKRSALLAFADIEFDGIMWVNGWKLFRSKDGSGYDLGFPSQKDKNNTKNDDGTDKYWNNVWFNMKDGAADKSRDIISQIKTLVVKKYESLDSDYSGRQEQRNNNEGWPSGFDEDDDIPF